MKYLILCVLLAFSSLSLAKTVTIKISDDDDVKSSAAWHCKVKPFMEEYEAFGSSKTEATYRVQKKCKAKHNEMHCDSVTCEGDDEVASDTGGWVCKLKPFTESYEAFHNSKTIAKAKVMKQCTKKNNEMHCDDPECSQAE